MFSVALYSVLPQPFIIALWSKGVYIPSLHFFCENNPELGPVFSRPLAEEDLFFLTIMGSYTSENNCSGQ